MEWDQIETAAPEAQAQFAIDIARQAAIEVGIPDLGSYLRGALALAERALAGETSAAASLREALQNEAGGLDFNELAFAHREDPPRLARIELCEFACAMALRAMGGAAEGEDPLAEIDHHRANAEALGLV